MDSKFHGLMRAGVCGLVVGSIVGIAVLAGCTRQNQPPVTAAEDSTPMVSPETVPDKAPPPQEDSTNALLKAQLLARKLQTSPFASANPALKMSYTRALAAQLNTNNAAAYAELQKLGKAPGLTPQQAQAVQQLLAAILSAAPGLATSTTESEPGPVYAFVADGEPPFSTADPSVAESFAAAELALKIGDYDRALQELQSISTHPQLNWQQKDAVDQLLSRIPQAEQGTASR